MEIIFLHSLLRTSEVKGGACMVMGRLVVRGMDLHSPFAVRRVLIKGEER